MPDTLNDFAAREPSPVESGRFRLAQLIVPTNVVLAGLLSVLSFAGVVEVTGISAYLGTFFLIGALVPYNLLRFERYASGRRTRALAKLRKPLGISAGVWFVVHSVVSVWEMFDLSLSSELVRQFLIGDMLAGVVAMLVFVALLATSFSALQRRLGKSWKPLQRLVWFAVPLALAHTILASGLDSPSIVFYLGLMAFAGFEYRVLRRRGTRGARTHLILIGAGVLTAALIYVVL